MMMTYNMTWDEVLNMTLNRFNACLRLANAKVNCEYQENYKAFMSKLPKDVKRMQDKNKEVINKFNKNELLSKSTR